MSRPPSSRTPSPHLALLLLSTLALAASLLPAPALAAEAPLLQELDALYAQREQPGTLQTLEARLATALAASPEDYELLWRQARARFWQADGSPNERKKALGKEVWAIAERAVALAPERPEGQLYAALGIGAYSQAAGILTALAEGLEGKFNARLDRALQLAPGLGAGTPLLSKGRYFYELPWPKRDLRRSRELLTRATEQHPANLRAWLYLAETQLADGEPKQAQASLQRALTGGVDYDPPEARRVKAMAKALEPRIQEKLR
jgi:cytochrome c-type biogenesis protein CcmH/NrfG